VEQSRRDDLEAIGYVLMYFLRGSLPWQGLKVDKKEDRYKKIYEKKKMTTPEELCVGFPNEFCTFIQYTRALSFEQNPDYDYLRNLMKKVMENNMLPLDYDYDWDKSKEKNIKSNANSIVSKNTNNVSNVNNVLFTSMSNQPEINVDSFRMNEKRMETDNAPGQVGITNNTTITQHHEEGGISKPNKFTTNEIKNKFDNKPIARHEPEVIHETKPDDKKGEKKKDDNCLLI